MLIDQRHKRFVGLHQDSDRLIESLEHLVDRFPEGGEGLLVRLAKMTQLYRIEREVMKEMDVAMTLKWLEARGIFGMSLHLRGSDLVWDQTDDRPQSLGLEAKHEDVLSAIKNNTDVKWEEDNV